MKIMGVKSISPQLMSWQVRNNENTRDVYLEQINCIIVRACRELLDSSPDGHRGPHSKNKEFQLAFSLMSLLAKIFGIFIL